MEISAEKTKLMANNTSGINTEIKVDAQKLETVTSLKYLGSVITDEASNVKLLSRIAQATAAQTKLKPVWNDRSISPSFKIRLMRSLVTSIFLCACEAWTLTGELQRKNTNHGNEVLRQNTTHLIQRPCYQRGSSCQDPADNRTTRNLLTIVKRGKLKWYGHVSRSSGLAKTILQGTMKGGRRHCRQKMRWEDTIREWTGLEFA